MAHHPKTLYGAALIVALGMGAGALLFALPACVSGAPLAGGVDTTPGIERANWADNVTITFAPEDETFRYESDGLPAGGVADAYLVPDDPSTMPFIDDPADSFWTLAGDEIVATPIDVTITTRPVYVEEPTLTDLGQIGVAIDGARIFNDYEDRERTVVALEDNVVHDHAAFVDECNGHPLGDGTTYHYHGVPTCISSELDVPGQHSYMIGVLQDGFPVYADKGAGGEVVTSDDLDECGGHVEPTPEFADGIYHYHMTADGAPYSVDCYHGEVEAPARRGPPPGGPPGRPDVGAAAERLGVSEAALVEALGEGPPDVEAAAARLGVSVEALREALPSPPDQAPPRGQ
ncbi:MAG TPA: YHYH protein [Bacteroidetes bacterium]|nr:YHYH protein [Bacteroidota bacterium]HIL56639.1 YHYH protein [Rhodothermales bacterium]